MTTMGSLDREMAQEFAHKALPGMLGFYGVQVIVDFQLVVLVAARDVNFEDNIFRVTYFPSSLELRCPDRIPVHVP